MPEPLWLYLMALLYFPNVTTCSAIADALDSVSPDRLTRMLQGPWSGHPLLHLALRTLCTVAGGYLSVEDTVVAKPYARLLGAAAWVWSNKDRTGLFGVSVMLLGWTDGQLSLPLACRVWHKGGASKDDVALELLSYARNRLKCKPAFVLFDSWDPSKKLLKRMPPSSLPPSRSSRAGCPSPATRPVRALRCAPAACWRHPALASRWRGACGPTPGAGSSGQDGSRVAWGGRTRSVEKAV